MTTGQRIASKRKELKLSQESLGEQLGVSRQSIYKWESDASLPEIEKLVSMSRLFGVSVGWLLGVEQDKKEPDTPGEDSGELTEHQIKMVEEIVDRYVAAQPKPPRRRRWPYAVAAILLCCVGANLFHRLDQLDTRYNNLQNSIGNLSSGVNREISTITNRVEAILKAQNDLTADYDCEVLRADLASNTVTFSARLLPKTYVAGMQVLFLVDDGSGTVEIAGIEGNSHVFTAEVTCTLSDSITLSAALLTDGVRQTQLLDRFSGLYSASLPYIDLSGLESSYLHTRRAAAGIFHLPQSYGWLRGLDEETKFGPVEIRDLKVGLFVNYRPVAWLIPTEKPDHWNLESAEKVFFLDELSLDLKPGDILHFAAIYTDEHGRSGAAPCIPAFECMGDEISWMQSSDATPFFQIENYIL